MSSIRTSGYDDLIARWISIVFLLFGLSYANVASSATYDLLLSQSANRSGPVSLANQTVSGNIYVFTAPNTGVRRVLFYLDNATTPYKTEGLAPYDLGGTAANGTALPFNTATLSDGDHTLQATIELTAGGSEVVSVPFAVSNSTPPPAALGFDSANLAFSAVEGTNPAEQTVGLTANNASAADFTVSDNASWLTVIPATGSTPASLSFAISTTGLAAGAYTATVTAAATGYVSASLTVNLTVTAAPSTATSIYDLKLSNSANRSGPVSLANQTVSGNIYVFTAPNTGVRRVLFYLDNAPTPYKTEGLAPFDLGGTASNGTALPFNTSTLTDGSHTLRATVELTAGGSETVTAPFTVRNSTSPPVSLGFGSASVAFSAVAGTSPATVVNLTSSDGSAASYSVSDDAAWLTASPASGSTPGNVTLSVSTTGLAAGTYTATVTATAPGYTTATLTVNLTVTAAPSDYDLKLSLAPDRSAAVSLAGQSVNGNIYVFTSPNTGVRSVSFYLDNATTAYKTEGAAPYDLAGTATNGAALPLNSATLADGNHTLTASVELTSGAIQNVNALFSVSNNTSTPSFVTDNFNDGNALGWTVVNDSPVAASRWRVANGRYRQDNDVGFYGSALQNAYHRGTYSYLGATMGLTDYRFQVTAIPQSLLGRDIGVMFRYVDNNNYYRLYISADDGGVRVEKKVNGVFSTLAKNARGYSVNVPLNIAIEVKGPLVQIGINDEDKLFGFYDASLQAGGVALYCRHACAFDDVSVAANSGITTLVISKPEAHSVATDSTIQASAVLLNKPAGSTAEVRFDLGGILCNTAQESPAGTGQFLAQCQAPAGTNVNDLTATLLLNGQSTIYWDTNVNVGTGGDNFLAVGDSITFGLGDEYNVDNSEPDGWVESTMGYEAPLTGALNQSNPYPSIVFNNGFPGDRSSTVLNSRIDSALARHSDANHVLVLLGTNDIGGTSVASGLGCVGTCANTFKGNMLAIINKIVAAGKTPIVARVPPRFGDSDTVLYSSPATATRNLLAQEYNTVITDELGLAPSQIGPDFYDVFLGAGINRFSLFSDYLHPNALGYRVMAQLWYNHLIGGTGLPFLLDSICVRPTGVSCSNPTVYKQDLIGDGDAYYEDAGFTLTGNLPAAIDGGVWVMTKNSDKAVSVSNYLTLTFSGTATLYVAYDDGDVNKPTWLTSGFVDTGLFLNTSNPASPGMRIFRKNNVAGNITLGGNMAPGAGGTPENYVVIVKPN